MTDPNESALSETETAPADLQADPRAMLPQYRSHKLVQAAKIAKIGPQNGDGSLDLFFEAVQYPDGKGHSLMPINVGKEYAAKHEPGVGGYYVLYADGYESWSPGTAFEEGYVPWPSAPVPKGDLDASLDDSLEAVFARHCQRYRDANQRDPGGSPGARAALQAIQELGAELGFDRSKL